jgi:NTE family protein
MGGLAGGRRCLRRQLQGGISPLTSKRRWPVNEAAVAFRSVPPGNVRHRVTSPRSTLALLTAPPSRGGLQASLSDTARWVVAIAQNYGKREVGGVAKVGLVLGAGGVVGQAYHSGVLAAIEHDWGWDPRSAEVIVGTSAGSITGTLLRTGVPASELAAWTVKAPLEAEGQILHQIVGHEVPEFDRFNPLELVRRPPSLPGREMLKRALLRPWSFRPFAASMALLAPGPRDIADQLRALSEVDGMEWPHEALWICAVGRRDGRRVVFGRPGTPEAPLHLAIAASCAVPGYFTPVRVGGHTYVDGGVHSPTNAAMLRRLSLDLVVVVSPMSGPPGVLPGMYAASRWNAARTLRREIKALERSGIPVVAFSPGPKEQAVMGDDFMARDRVDDIVRESFLAAGAHLASPRVRDMRGFLHGASTASA